MKNAIILHGTDCAPNSHWFPDTKKFLEEAGYSVWVPQLPNADKPDIKKWLPFVLKNGKFDSETILIGHSVGVPLILSVLENINVKINKAILVAGFSKPLGKAREPILQTKYNWNEIKNKVNEIVFINSDNDPWGCNDVQGRYMFDKLGGMLILLRGEGHMGSDTYHQPYKKFPLLKQLLTQF